MNGVIRGVIEVKLRATGTYRNIMNSSSGIQVSESRIVRQEGMLKAWRVFG